MDKSSQVEEVNVKEVERLDDGIDQLLDAWADLQLRIGIDEEAAMWDYMDVDDQVITGGAFSLAEIVSGISATEKDDDQIGDSIAMDIEGVESAEPIISRQQSAFDLVRRYVEKNTADPVILGCSDQLDDFFYKERQKKEQQSNLTDFFPVL